MVPEEDFFRFLPYMGMAAMWPGPFEQTFFLPSHGGSIWNLTGPVVAEEMFGRLWRTDNDGRRRPTYPISSPVRLRWAKSPIKWYEHTGNKPIKGCITKPANLHFLIKVLDDYSMSSQGPKVFSCGKWRLITCTGWAPSSLHKYILVGFWCGLTQYELCQVIALVFTFAKITVR